VAKSSALDSEYCVLTGTVGYRMKKGESNSPDRKQVTQEAISKLLSGKRT